MGRSRQGNRVALAVRPGSHVVDLTGPSSVPELRSTRLTVVASSRGDRRHPGRDGRAKATHLHLHLEHPARGQIGVWPRQHSAVALAVDDDGAGKDFEPREDRQLDQWGQIPLVATTRPLRARRFG